MESLFNQSLSTKSGVGSGTQSRNCLCIFDIDRTITGRQSDTHRCPGNRVVGGNDDAYGGGPVTLSQLGQHVYDTWCSRDCHVRAISAHHRARPNIPVPQNILSCNKGCKARKARRMARELGVRKSQVYMFDDKAKRCKMVLSSSDIRDVNTHRSEHQMLESRIMLKTFTMLMSVVLFPNSFLTAIVLLMFCLKFVCGLVAFPNNHARRPTFGLSRERA